MSPQPGNAESPPARRQILEAAGAVTMPVAGFAMVIVALLDVLSWPFVLGWTAAAGVVLAAELARHRFSGAGRAAGGGSTPWATVLRMAATALYALAALVLIWRGSSPERLFAFAMITASMLLVLMRHYRSRWTLLGSLAPYVLVLGFVAWTQAKAALAHGHVLGAVVASFTLLTLGIQFAWARGQLARSWDELMNARRAAEDREAAAEAASRAKSNFLATMSHELRTPLHGVLGMAQALSNERLSDTQRERVKIIRRSSESLLAVLNDLLDLSKIETHSLELELAEFDLEHLVRGVVAAYEPLARKKDLSFAFEISEGARGHYLGDSARIRRILYSLADNAVKFTDTGGVTLSVDREGGDLVFRVDDSGIGIAEEDLAHLFEGFFQADASLSRRHGGAGLGLALCREMTQLMGGQIEAISEFGAGSTFLARLPLPRATPHAVAPQDSGRESARRSDLRVLAAEDNDTNQLVLKTLLAQAGIEVTMVENGRQALEAWEAQVWDIILMDIQMPIMDGVEATREIRRREAATGRPRTPILAVTANAMTHQVVEYQAAGMDGMAPKPIDLNALFDAMQHALEPPRREAAQASAA